jgi:predicted RNA binding protein YcfA (HicA-like mRNA interferase family)
MSALRKLISKVLDGLHDHSFAFRDLRRLLKRLGFEERIRGDHHIFTRSDVVEILNLQPSGTLAKPYQVKQVRQVIIDHKLAGEAS